MTDVASIKQLERRPWSQTSAFIRNNVCFENGALREEIIDCVQQIHEFGSSADDYIRRADWELRFTLGYALKKLRKVAHIPDDTDVFQWLQQIGISLLRLHSLGEDDRDRIQRFSAMVGSLPPSMCVSQHYQRCMQGAV